jgi:4-hydroxybenzoate polyprenyltransferase
MKMLFEWLRLARIKFVLASGFATWCSYQVSHKPAGGDRGLALAGASLYHYGTAWHMYHNKREWVRVNHNLLRLAGVCLLIFGWTCIAVVKPPIGAVLTYLADYLIIAFYFHHLAPRWQLKNVSIALACTSPFLFGYFFGPGEYPAMRWWFQAVFCLFLAREVLKDVQDMNADFGFRRTIPLRFGWVPARWFAGLATLVGANSIANAMARETENNLLCQVLLLTATIWCAWVSASLIFIFPPVARRHRESGWILVALGLILTALTMLVYGL